MTRPSPSSGRNERSDVMERFPEVRELALALDRDRPRSVDDVKRRLQVSPGVRGMVESHNTESVVAFVRSGGKELALKCEGGDHPKTRGELEWYRRHKLPTVEECFLGGVALRWISMIVMQRVTPLDALSDLALDEMVPVSVVADLALAAFESDRRLFESTRRATSSREVFAAAEQKLVERSAAAQTHPWLAGLFSQDVIRINDVLHLGPFRALEVARSRGTYESLVSPEVGVVHGDLHLGNIHRTDKGILALDPNVPVFRPLAYDGGKILQSMHSGYEIVMRGNFRVSQSAEDGFTLTLKAEQRLNELLRAVCCAWEPGFLVHSRFMEAMHFLTMAPHHVSKADEALALLLIGVMRLNEVLRTGDVEGEVTA